MKRFSFILYVISIIILGILGGWIGAYIYKINQISNIELPVLDGMENKNLKDELALMVNDSENIISPNATLVTKMVYNKCGHILNEYTQIDNKYVNLNKVEFEKIFLKDSAYSKLETFTPKKIVVLKEINENCNQHYIIKEKDGLIIVYRLNENNNSEIYKSTNIAVEYLTENDKIELKKGIEVVGDGELNSKLEDYV